MIKTVLYINSLLNVLFTSEYKLGKHKYTAAQEPDTSVPPWIEHDGLSAHSTNIHVTQKWQSEILSGAALSLWAPPPQEVQLHHLHCIFTPLFYRKASEHWAPQIHVISTDAFPNMTSYLITVGLSYFITPVLQVTWVNYSGSQHAHTYNEVPIKIKN